MKFGYFDDNHQEYVIKQPNTPLPWMNYLGNESFYGIITNTAGGYSFYLDARLRRLTRYRYNNVPPDYGGRYLYIKDLANGCFWSPSWQPTQNDLDGYSCRHGLGYTTIASSYSGISTETRYFIPNGENLEIWQMRIINHRLENAELDIFSCIEFCLWDAQDDATNFQRNFSIGEVEVVDEVIYHKTEYRERRDHFAYFACSMPIIGFDTQRESFLGPYRGWDRPLAVERGACTGSIANGWSPVGVLQVKVKLEPGETRQVIFLLGYHENPKERKFDPPGSQTLNKRTVTQVIQKYTDENQVEAAFGRLREYWHDLLASFQVETPDVHTNRMVNIWNAYQCMVTFNISRSASLFESGIGRGIGFRDSNQDLLGFVHMVPQRARQRILELAATQLPSGGAYHQYQPLTKRGNNDVGSNFNDDPLWLILAVSAYMKETGDHSILDEQVPYDNQLGSETILYEHLQRCISYILNRLGPHGLPLIGRADWNDCLNLNCFSTAPGQSFQTTTNKNGTVAESILIAGLFVLAAKEMALLAHHRGLMDESNQYISTACHMEQVVCLHGWDGEWFRRAYDDFGEPVGSIIRREGQIFIEPQGMCVMAGLGLVDGRAEKALDAVRERLATPHGILLQQPAFSQYYLELGEISSYPPGYKENAGIFCHTNPWVIIAETRLGRGDQAFDYYTRINPSAREAISEVHRCEPYVYAQMIAGRDAPTHGEAKNSWLTGAAAWNYVAITQWILGIRPSLNGLTIEPVLPEGWDGYKATRRFRDNTYHITVERIKDGSQARIMMNRELIDGNTLPLPEKKQGEVLVNVFIK
jgi:cellobiose phosphorylase